MSPKELDTFLKVMAKNKCPCKHIVEQRKRMRTEKYATKKRKEPSATSDRGDTDRTKQSNAPSHRLMIPLRRTSEAVATKGDDRDYGTCTNPAENPARRLRLAQNRVDDAPSRPATIATNLPQEADLVDGYCIVCSDETVTRHEEAVAFEATRNRRHPVSTVRSTNGKRPATMRQRDSGSFSHSKNPVTDVVEILPTTLRNWREREERRSGEDPITDAQKTYFNQLVKRRRLVNDQHEKYVATRIDEGKPLQHPEIASRRMGRKKETPEEQAEKIKRAQRLLAMRLGEQLRNGNAFPTDAPAFAPPNFSNSLQTRKEPQEQPATVPKGSKRYTELDDGERGFEQDVQAALREERLRQNRGFEQDAKVAFREERLRPNQQIPDRINSSNRDESEAVLGSAAREKNRADAEARGVPLSPPRPKSPPSIARPPSSSQLKRPPVMDEEAVIDEISRLPVPVAHREVPERPVVDEISRLPPPVSHREVPEHRRSSSTHRSDQDPGRSTARHEAASERQLPMSQADVALAASAAAERVAATIGDGGDELMDRLQEAMGIEDLDARDAALQAVEDDMRREEEVLRELILAKKHSRLKRRIQEVQSGYAQLASHLLNPDATPAPDPPTPATAAALAAEQPSFATLAKQLLAKANQHENRQHQRHHRHPEEGAAASPTELHDQRERQYRDRERHHAPSSRQGLHERDRRYRHRERDSPSEVQFVASRRSSAEHRATSRPKHRSSSTPGFTIAPEVAAALRAQKNRKQPVAPPHRGESTKVAGFEHVSDSRRSHKSVANHSFQERGRRHPQSHHGAEVRRSPTEGGHPTQQHHPKAKGGQPSHQAVGHHAHPPPPPMPPHGMHHAAPMQSPPVHPQHAAVAPHGMHQPAAPFPVLPPAYHVPPQHAWHAAQQAAVAHHQGVPAPIMHPAAAMAAAAAQHQMAAAVAYHHHHHHAQQQQRQHPPTLNHNHHGLAKQNQQPAQSQHQLHAAPQKQNGSSSGNNKHRRVSLQ
uniref:Uncharacterized protein n=1 Tax=Grammatophora oceanica TaxID=210454 RepID=A0A7S1V5N9_9STRA